jgi:hypothetical protein
MWDKQFDSLPERSNFEGYAKMGHNYSEKPHTHAAFATFI